MSENFFENLRQVRVELHIISGSRMDEPERTCMQQLSADPDSGNVSALPLRSVQLISCKRMMDVCHVHPYLMRASCLETGLYQGVSSESLKHTYMRDRAAAARAAHCMATRRSAAVAVA